MRCRLLLPMTAESVCQSVCLSRGWTRLLSGWIASRSRSDIRRKLHGPQPPCSRVILRAFQSPGVSTSNRTSIRSAVFAQHHRTIDRHTYRATGSSVEFFRIRFRYFVDSVRFTKFYRPEALKDSNLAKQRNDQISPDSCSSDTSILKRSRHLFRFRRSSGWRSVSRLSVAMRSDGLYTVQTHARLTWLAAAGSRVHGVVRVCPST